METTPETPAALVLRRWAQVAAAGAFRTGVEGTQRRRLPGDLGVLVQFNASHRQLKRPVDKTLMASKDQQDQATPARPAFNFTRAKAVEFLAGMAFDAVKVELFELAGDCVDGFRDQAASVVLVNVSPLMHGHSLVLLDWATVKPQQLKRDLLRRGVGVAQAIGRDSFALGFNSAGAWSSVNHFHFQGFFFPPPDEEDRLGSWTNFPVTYQPRIDMFQFGTSVVAQRLPQWPMACYAVGLRRDEMSSDLDRAARVVMDVVETAWALIDVLQQREIPHNVLITSAPELVVWVFPRQPQQENGVHLFGSDADDGKSSGRLRFAIAEVAGLVVAGDDVAFRGLSEAMFAQILRREISISPGLAAEVEREWMETVGAPKSAPRDG